MSTQKYFGKCNQKTEYNDVLMLLYLFPNKKWNYRWLSINPNITWDIVKNTLEKKWDWYELSRNPNITWGIVKNNPEKPWSYYGLSLNPNITWDIV